MSGGSWSYAYSQIHEASVSMLPWDYELSELLRDLSKVCHDCEWADSSDISDESAKKSIAEFKAKWFAKPRDERLMGYIDEIFDKAKKSAVELIGNG